MRGWNPVDAQFWYLDDKPLHEPGRRAMVSFSEGDYDWQECWIWNVTNETGSIVVSGVAETEEEAKRVALETAAALALPMENDHA